jgi:DNA adenine methylase
MNIELLINNLNTLQLKNSYVKNIINNYDNIKINKPILKWIGGKTQIIDKILFDFPLEINNYHEIFLGGGSILFGLLTYIKLGIIKIFENIYVYDINEPLIYVYKNIQNNHEKLYIKLQELIKEYNNCDNKNINRKPININEAKDNKENYFYWIREKYNKLSIEEKKSILGSAMFIFLNKTCFRGMYREGKNGFNVPYGNYNNPEIINKKHLDEIHELIHNVNFICSDYKASLLNIKEDDFIYLDPPYIKECSTSFVNYTEKGFNEDDKLLYILKNINNKFILSNSNSNIIKDFFQDNKYKIEEVICKRSINSKKPDSKTIELLIKNY